MLLAEPARSRASGSARARQVGRAAPRRLPRDLRRGHREAARAGRGRRARSRASTRSSSRTAARSTRSSRAGYFPSALSVTHGARKTPHVAMIGGERRSALAVMLVLLVHARLGPRRGGDRRHAPQHGRVRRDDLVRRCRRCRSSCCAGDFPHIARPYRSPLGVPGAVATVAIALVTLVLPAPPTRSTAAACSGSRSGSRSASPTSRCVGRNHLVLSPEEEFAVKAAR